MDRRKKARPCRPGQIRGLIWCSKSVVKCVGVWLLMTSHLSEIFFQVLGMSRNGSQNRLCAPKNRPI